MSKRSTPPTDQGPPSEPTTYALLQRTKRGDRSALNSLFERCVPPLRRWARGRLPLWARGVAETADLVQDVVLQVFKRLDGLDVRHKGALQAYLRQSIQNRIRDELRAFSRRPPRDPLDTDLVDPQASPLDHAVDAETQRRYVQALRRLRSSDQELIVGSIELGYSYEQLAAATRRPSAESARIAIRRALTRLAEEMDRV